MTSESLCGTLSTGMLIMWTVTIALKSGHDTILAACRGSYIVVLNDTCVYQLQNTSCVIVLHCSLCSNVLYTCTQELMYHHSRKPTHSHVSKTAMPWDVRGNEWYWCLSVK